MRMKVSPTKWGPNEPRRVTGSEVGDPLGGGMMFLVTGERHSKTPGRDNDINTGQPEDVERRQSQGVE